MGWGDEIMVTGIARRQQELSPLPVRVLDKRGRRRWNEIWRGNPRLALPDFEGKVQLLSNGRAAGPTSNARRRTAGSGGTGFVRWARSISTRASGRSPTATPGA